MEGLTYRLTFLATFLVIGVIAVKQSTTVKTAADFAVAGRSLNASGVAWIIIGTLVGGVATIGTVQAAYDFGISAGIFTFGSGLSCLLLGCFFARALREQEAVTVAEYLGYRFGEPFRRYSSAITAVGMFIHVIGQFLASIAILKAVFGFHDVVAVFLTAALIALFVATGGIAGAGLIGKIKFFMLYLIMFACAAIAWWRGGGLSGIVASLPDDSGLLGFSRYGNGKAALDLVSMLVGVLSTQIYLQAIFAARNVRQARNGAFLSAVVIPPIGVFGIIVGLYLRGRYPELAGNTAQALPFFLTEAFPPVIAAFFSAGILLVVLGTGAGLVLGVTTNICNDFLIGSSIMRQVVQPVRLFRSSAVAILLLAALLVFTGLDSTILSWSYMSMGLRGSAVFAGLFMLVFLERYAGSKSVVILLYLLPPIYVFSQLFD